VRRIATVVLVLGLCACGGGSTTVSGGTSSGEPATSSAASAASSAASGEAPAAGDDAPAGAAKSLCAFLGQETPRLEAVGSEVGALAQLAIALAKWTEDNPTFKLKDAEQLDTLTTQGCPQTRTRLLKAIGAKQFQGAI
jgi:hypothetical protein